MVLVHVQTNRHEGLRARSVTVPPLLNTSISSLLPALEQAATLEQATMQKKRGNISKGELQHLHRGTDRTVPIIIGLPQRAFRNMTCPYRITALDL